MITPDDRVSPGEHGHPTTAHRDACPVCNPDKTVPQLNEAFRTSNQAAPQTCRDPLCCFCYPAEALKRLREHYQRCIDACELEEHKQEFRDELTKLEQLQ